MPAVTVTRFPDVLERARALPAAAPLLPALPPNQPVYLVGGAVRDLLLGDSPADLDLVVEGDAAALGTRLGGRMRAHGRFGTVAVTLDGRTYDIAAARTERYPVPGALPDVQPASLAEDLGRRDFTVNSLALALSSPAAGELTAHARALADLEARVLRVLHDRSFRDDPTRLFRLARYAARLRFEIAPDTDRLAREAVTQGALGTVSGERLGNELRLLTREREPVAALLAARTLGLDEALAPGFGLRDPELARRALGLLPPDARPDLLVLAAAGLTMAGRELRALLERLAFEAGDRETVVAAADGAAAAARELRQAESASQVAESLRGRPVELAALAGALGAAEQAREWLDGWRHVTLEIRGEDLLAAGIAPGPAIGAALRAALASKLDGRARDRHEELRAAIAAIAATAAERRDSLPGER